MSDREMARAALKRGYDDCEARNVCNCGKSDCSAYLDAIATALAQARAEGLRQAAEVADEWEQPGIVGTREWLDQGNMLGEVAAAIRARIGEGGE